MHVLHNVHGSLVARGLALDVHPIGLDCSVRAGARGLGFVDASEFAPIVEAMDAAVARAIEDGLFTELRTRRRHVVERFDDAAEALAEADGFVNLRLPPAVRRRLLRTDERPVEFVDTVLYRLLKKRGRTRR